MTPDAPTAATKNGDIAARIEEEDEQEQEQEHEEQPDQEMKKEMKEPQEQLLNLNTDAATTDAVADTNGASCKLLKSAGSTASIPFTPAPTLTPYLAMPL